MKKSTLSFFILISLYFNAQVGGINGFSSLSNVFNARQAALGGSFISAKDNDVNIAISNPSLLSENTNKQWSINQLLLPNGTKAGMLCFSTQVKRFGISTSGAIRYISYGQLKETTENGTVIGTINPSDYILTSGFGKVINPRFSVGLNTHILYAQYGNYNSIGLGVDFSASFDNPEKLFLATILLKNIGYQVKGFIPSSNRMLPTELQIAISKKLEHAPFRFSFLFHHLNTWDISYFDPLKKATYDPFSRDSIQVPKANTIEKIIHHITPQAELLLSANFHFRIAFSYYSRQSFKLQNRPGLSGFTFGIGMKFKRFTLDYGFIPHSVAGYTNAISLLSNLNDWKRKK